MRPNKAETAVQGSSFANAWSFFDTWGPCSQCAGSLLLLALPWHIGRCFLPRLWFLVAMVAAQPVGVIIGKLDPQVRSCSLSYKCAVFLKLWHYSAPCWWSPTRPKQLPKVRVLLKPGHFLTHTHTHTHTIHNTPVFEQKISIRAEKSMRVWYITYQIRLYNRCYRP